MRCVNHFGWGNTSISGVAQMKRIPKQTLARWIRQHRRFGESSLENRKPGAKETEINPNFEQLILLQWKERKRSAHKLWIDMKKKDILFQRGRFKKFIESTG